MPNIRRALTSAEVRARRVYLLLGTVAVSLVRLVLIG